MQFEKYYSGFLQKVKTYFYIFAKKVHNSAMDKVAKNCYDYLTEKGVSFMFNPRQRFERFCFKHQKKGIPNLMLYISLGSALVYIFNLTTQSDLLSSWLCFDYSLILQGQVWRLFTYALVYDAGNILLTAISLLCYFSLGRAMENVWGTLRFNLYYLCGIILIDAYAMLMGALVGDNIVIAPYIYPLSSMVTVFYLNMSLFLGYATLYPDAHFTLFFIIPVKAWIFALIDFFLVAYNVIALPFPYNIFPLIALANYFLFFGKDVINLLPRSWRVNASRLFRKKQKTVKKERPKVVPFPSAGSYRATVATVKAPYTHKCTVCGRTDVSDPDLEFRYCSRCTGYHCYCQDHISNHEHITES